jgi:hypothetical protein
LPPYLHQLLNATSFCLSVSTRLSLASAPVQLLLSTVNLYAPYQSPPTTLSTPNPERYHLTCASLPQHRPPLPPRTPPQHLPPLPCVP